MSDRFRDIPGEGKYREPLLQHQSFLRVAGADCE